MTTIRATRRAVPLVLAAALAACDQGLTEINENPNNPESVPVASVLQSGIWAMTSNSAGRGVFGEWTTLYHLSTWAQHTAQSAFNEEDNYTPRPGIPEDIWDEMYGDALSDLTEVRVLAERAGDQNLAAVAEILLVYGFLFLTDLYGDIPYSQALDLERYAAPEIDPQSEIYPDLLRRLDEASARIEPGASTPWDSGDILYGGDLGHWLEFANSLRLRIAMRISDTPASGDARQHFTEAWGSNRFDSHEDNADVDWTGTLPSQNPIYETLVLGGRMGDFRVSETFVDALEARGDPRLALFASPAVSDGEFRGLPNGYLPAEVGGGTTAGEYSTVGPALLAPDAPSVLMSYAEVLFLGAEAAARGWIPADPASLYRQGIEASMREHGVAEAQIEAYLAQPSVAYTGVEDILLQKWIALFLQGPEAFNEVRRTGVPDLPLPGQAVIDQLPARMPYPANESLYNPKFEPYADIPYTTPLWWMEGDA